jgi:hypothetical protein
LTVDTGGNDAKQTEKLPVRRADRVVHLAKGRRTNDLRPT